MSQALKDLLTASKNLLALVRLQNGNLHDDVNQLQEFSINAIDAAEDALKAPVLDFELLDQSDTKSRLKGQAKLIHGQLCLGFEGYAEPNTDKGTPIIVEIWSGKLRLLYWNDLKNEEVTAIDMEGAREHAKTP